MAISKELEKKLKATSEWGEEDTTPGIADCNLCLKPFADEPLRMWEGKNKFQQEGSELDNCIFHRECLKLYRRIKALVFKQCSTPELEEELEGRKWLRTVFAKVRQSLKVDEEERQEAKILQSKF